MHGGSTGLEGPRWLQSHVWYWPSVGLSSKVVWFPYVAVLGAVFLESEDASLMASWSLSAGTCATSFPWVKASHKATSGSREWRNRHHLWLRREAKSHCKGACTMEWEEFVAIKILTTCWENSNIYQGYSFSNPWTCPQSILKEMLYSFPYSGWAQNISGKFTLEEIQMANEHMKIGLTSLTIGKCK